MYSGHPAAEIRNTVEQQERRLGDLQNDIHQMADSLPGLWEAWASNLTVATTEANQTELGEWQVPRAEEEPGHVLEDEWKGRQEGPNFRGPTLPHSVTPWGGCLLLQGLYEHMNLLQSFQPDP